MKTRFMQMPTKVFPKALIVGALSCALLGATPDIASAKPTILRGPIVSDHVFSGSRNLPQLESMSKPIALMTEMLNYAKIGRVGNGTKTAVYATVVITSSSSKVRPGRSSVTYAHGLLTLVGNKGSERFVGDLTKFNNIGIANPNAPFVVSDSSGSSTRISIFANGRVVINSAFRVGAQKRSYTQSFNSDGSDGFLWGRDTSDGTTQLISVALAKSVFPLGGASQTVAPQPPPASAPVGPRGMRVRVTPSFKITNSDDGMGFFKKDMTIELFGSLYLGNKRSWSRGGSNELSATKGNVVRGDSTEVEIFYDNPASWRLQVRGSLEDSDKPSVNGDIVWKGDENVDLKAAIEQQGGQVVLKGQADDEYANLRLKVEKIADIN